MKATFYINVVMPDGTDLDDVTVKVDYDAIYEPAKLSGPMDQGSPMYTEMTLNSVEVEGDYFDSHDNPVPKLEVHIQVLAKYQDRLEELCWSDYHETRADRAYEDDRYIREED